MTVAIQAAPSHRIALTTALALALVAPSWWFQARYGFGAWDEGFLWYGAQQTARGAIPIRDFMAYDPGRYYWAAATMAMLGNQGMLALRFSAALFQGLGMAAGAWCLARLDLRWPLRLAAAIVLLLWTWPWFRAFDCAAALVLVSTIAWMLSSPRPRRNFIGGVVLGLIAILGRNHGLYGGLAMLAALILGAPRGRGVRGYLSPLAACGAGVVVGYSPMLVLLAADAGFLSAFVADNLELLRAGATNIALPVPWPQLAFVGHEGALETARKFIIGMLFVALPAFFLVGSLRLWRDGSGSLRRFPVFAACVLLALPYAHFAFSRADLSHLANGIAPLLLGVVAWPRLGDRPRVRIAPVAALLVASVVVMVPVQPGVAGRIAPDWIDMRIDGDVLRMPPASARQVEQVRGILARHPPSQRKEVLFTPYWSGMYPVFGLQSPIWEIYALESRSEAFQRAEIRRMQTAGVRLALVQDPDVPLDGREDLRYRNTHPLLNAYLAQHFSMTREQGGLEVFVRNAGEGDAAARESMQRSAPPREADIRH